MTNMRLKLPNNPLIPAKAGTQPVQAVRLGGHRKNWIPAFAGMSGEFE